MTWQDVRGWYEEYEDPEPSGCCPIHGDYWTDDCTACGRPAKLPELGSPPCPSSQRAISTEPNTEETR